MRILCFLLLLLTGLSPAFSQIRQITEEEINDQNEYIESFSPALVGEEQVAIEKLEKYIEDHPTRHAAYYQLARLYRETGNERACLNAIEKAVTLAPEVEWYLVMQARYQEDYQHWVNAAETYEKLMQLEPDHSNYWISAAHAYLNAGNPNKSLSLLKELESRIGIQPEITQKKYLIYKSLGKYTEAVEAVRSLVDKFPQNTSYLLILGELYAEMGEKDAERKVYQQVLAIDSSVTEARIRMSELSAGTEGELLTQLMPVVKDPELSIDLKIQKLIPFLRDVDALDSAESAQLIKGLQALVESHSRDAKAYTMLADGYFNTAQLRKALQYYEKAEELQPNISTVWVQHIETLSLLDEHEKVLELAEKAFAYFPNQIEFYLQAAESALSLDRAEIAREYLESSSFMVGTQAFFRQRFDALAALTAAAKDEEGFPESYIIEQAGYKFIVPQSALLLLQHADLEQQEWLEAVIQQAREEGKADFMAQIAAAYASHEMNKNDQALAFLENSILLGASNYPSVYLLKLRIQKLENDTSGIQKTKQWLDRMGYEPEQESN